MPLRLLHLAALLGLPAIGLTLWAWGQPLTSASGEIRLWVNSIWSSENSQQVADWYSLSHAVHGLLLGLLSWALWRRIGYAPVYALAIATGVGWEIVEHTELVLSRFRAITLYQGYLGDTVLNATMDYVFMMTGFFVGSTLRPLWGVLVIVALELTSSLIARDSLVLTTIHTLWPVAALDAWQDEINPRTHPELLDAGGD
jgi:hypothetical protein